MSGSSEPIKHSQVIEPDFYANYIKSAKEALAVTEKLNSGLGSMAKGAGKGLVGNPKSVADLKQEAAAIKEIDALEKAANETRKQKLKLEADIARAETEEAKNIERLRQQKAESNAQLRDTVKLNNAAKGSYDALSAELAIVARQLKKLTDAERTETEQGKKLVQQKLALNNQLKAMDAQTGVYTRNVGNYTSAYEKLGTGLTKLIATAGGLYAGFRFLESSFDAQVEAEKNAKQLGLAMKNAGDDGAVALSKLLKQSEELQKNGIFSDDATQQAQTQLANYGLTATQIQDLIPLIEDMAAATGKDLGEATDIVIKGINGQMKGLKKLGIDYKDTGDRAENLALLTDKLTKFQGANAAQMDTVAGRLDRLKNIWDDFKENVGSFLINQGSQWLDFWDILTGKMTIAAKLQKDFSNLMKGDMEAGLAERTNRVDALKGDPAARAKEIAKSLTELKDAYAAVAKEQEIAGKADKSGVLYAQKTAELALAKQEYYDFLKYVNGLNTAMGSGEGDDGLISRTKEHTKAIIEQTQVIKDNSIAWQGLLNIQQLQNYNDERERFFSQFSDAFKESDIDIAKLTQLRNDDIISAEEYHLALLYLQKKAEEERMKIEKDAALARKKEREKEMNDISKELELIEGAVKKGLEQRNAMMEKHLSMERDQINDEVQIQQDLFTKGYDNSLAQAERLKAENMERQIQLEKKKQKEEQSLELAHIFLEFFKSYAKDGDINAAAKAFAQTLIAKGISDSIAGKFASGVEDFKGKGTGTSDSNLIAFSAGESVVTARGTKETKGLVSAINEMGFDGAKQWAFENVYVPEFIASTLGVRGSKDNQLSDSSEVVTAIKEVAAIMKNKKESDVKWDSLGNLVKTELKDGNRITEIYKRRVL